MHLQRDWRDLFYHFTLLLSFAIIWHLCYFVQSSRSTRVILISFWRLYCSFCVRTLHWRNYFVRIENIFLCINFNSARAFQYFFFFAVSAHHFTEQVNSPLNLLFDSSIEMIRSSIWRVLFVIFPKTRNARTWTTSKITMNETKIYRENSLNSCRSDCDDDGNTTQRNSYWIPSMASGNAWQHPM